MVIKKFLLKPEKNILFNMKILPKQFINFKEYFVLLICLLISLILLFSNNTNQIETLKILTLDLMGSFQARITSFNRYSTLKDENDFLRYQNTLLALENSQMREALLENKRLRNLIGFKDRNKYHLIAAKVISVNFTGFMNHIFLEVGKEDGVKKHLPLVLPDGLVGRIYQVGRRHSIGHLLCDQNFRVSAEIQRSGIKGIIGWKSGQICELNEIPNRSDVRVGDLVVTSGYSEIFPEGIYIGKVISAVNTQRGLFMKIRVKPGVDFNKLEEVFIIINQKLKD